MLLRSVGHIARSRVLRAKVCRTSILPLLSRSVRNTSSISNATYASGRMTNGISRRNFSTKESQDTTDARLNELRSLVDAKKVPLDGEDLTVTRTALLRALNDAGLSEEVVERFKQNPEFNDAGIREYLLAQSNLGIREDLTIEDVKKRFNITVVDLESVAPASDAETQSVSSSKPPTEEAKKVGLLSTLLFGAGGKSTIPPISAIVNPPTPQQQAKAATATIQADAPGFGEKGNPIVVSLSQESFHALGSTIVSSTSKILLANRFFGLMFALVIYAMFVSLINSIVKKLDPESAKKVFSNLQENVDQIEKDRESNKGKKEKKSRGSNSSGGGGLAAQLFGPKSKDYRLKEASNVKFADVKGCDEAKQELIDIVAFLKDPEKFSHLGAEVPTGIMLLGPPGTGKTMLAKAVAGESGVPFFYASGSEFDEMLVGVGARRIREMFDSARAEAPAVVFIDEIDAVATKRGPLSMGSGSRMTLNQLLVELDGFDTNSGVIVIAASNHGKDLDGAVLRPGRFDRKIKMQPPDLKGREEILEVYADKLVMSKDVDLRKIARGTPGCTGADLKNMMNQAAIRATLRNAEAVEESDLEEARDVMWMGTQWKSRVMPLEERRNTAYHEAGHAVMALALAGKGAQPVHKATILPRGFALGMVMQLPKGDNYSQSLQQMKATMEVCMGGRVAEQLKFGEENVTSGAGSDLQKATSMARNMVLNWGLGPKVGQRTIASDENLSQTMLQNIDDDVKSLLKTAYENTEKVLIEHADSHERIAQALLVHETLDANELQLLFEGKPLRKKPHGPALTV